MYTLLSFYWEHCPCTMWCRHHGVWLWPQHQHQHLFLCGMWTYFLTASSVPLYKNKHCLVSSLCLLAASFTCWTVCIFSPNFICDTDRTHSDPETSVHLFLHRMPAVWYFWCGLKFDIWFCSDRWLSLYIIENSLGNVQRNVSELSLFQGVLQNLNLWQNGQSARLFWWISIQLCMCWKHIENILTR